MKSLKILVLVAAALALTGCYHLAANTTVTPATDLEAGITGMSAFNFGYNPANLNAKVGESVNLSISSDGTHTLTIDELGVNQRLSKGNNSVTFTPNKAGNFEYYCNIPGHKERGMIGVLQVTSN